MGSAASDIRAGRAFVEILIKDSAVSKGLKKVQTELKYFGDGLTAIGKKAMVLGTAITAPILAATKSWASANEELFRMSQRTGMAVEQLSALQYAAEETGVSFDAVESGIKRMQKAVVESARGKGGPDFLQGLVGKNSEQQLETIADRIAAIQNPAERTAVAMQVFGSKGAAMLPILEQGARGIRDWRQEAEAAGRIETAESTAAAAMLATAWRQMLGSVTLVYESIATALAPMLQKVAGTIAVNVRAVAEWIGQHKQLVTVLFSVGAGLAGAGVALFAVGKAMTVLSGIAGGIRTGLAAVGHVFDLLLMPLKMAVGLFGSALSGALSIAKGAFSMIGSVIGGVVDAGLWVLSTTLGIVTGAWDLLSGAIKITKTVMTGFAAAGDMIIGVLSGVVSAVTGAFSAIMTLVSLGPAGLLIIVPAVLLLAVAWKGLEAGVRDAGQEIGELGSKAGAAAGAIKDVVTDAASQAIAAGTAIRNGVSNWAGSLRAFAVNVGSIASQVFGRLKTDVMSGFRNLVGDVTQSWGVMQEALQAGDFGGAMKVGLAGMMLEWTRFRNWLSDLWEELKPTWNTAVENAAGAIGDVLTGLKIGWGDMWDSIMKGLGSFTKSLSSGLKTLVEGLKAALHYVSMLPGTFDETREAGRKAASESFKRKEGESPEDARKRRGQKEDEDDLDFVNRKGQESVDAYISTTIGNGPNLPEFGARSADQKTADDKAARESGAQAKAAVSSALTTTPATQAAAAADKQREAADAERRRAEFLAAQDEAVKSTAAAKAARDKQIEDMKKKAGTGTKDDLGGLTVGVGSGGAKTTFSASEAAGMGMGGGPLQKIASHSEKQTDYLSKIHKHVEKFSFEGTMTSILQPSS